MRWPSTAAAWALPAASVAWGVWADGGLVGEALHLHVEFAAMASPRWRLHWPSPALHQALDPADETAPIVADIDWARFAPPFAAARPRPLLDELPEAGQALSAPGARSRDEREAKLVSRLRALPSREQLPHLLSIVEAQVAAVLRHADVSSIDPDRGFNDLGLDSPHGDRAPKAAPAGTAPCPCQRPLPSTTLRPATLPGCCTAPWCRVSVRRPAPRGGARLGVAAPASDDPIAIVALALRLPGGAVDLESFWSVLSQGVDAAGLIPATRWNADAVYDPDPEAKGKGYTREASFIDGIDLFDAMFFHQPAGGQVHLIRSTGCCSRRHGRRWSRPAWSRRR